MMKKLGFAVPNLGASHMNYSLIRQINLFMAERFDTDIVLFYETLDLPCLPPACSRMQIHEGYGFDGPIVATALTTAEKLIELFTQLDVDVWCGPAVEKHATLHVGFAGRGFLFFGARTGMDNAFVVRLVTGRRSIYGFRAFGIRILR